jgi:hypothetical protein
LSVKEDLPFNEMGTLLDPRTPHGFISNDSWKASSCWSENQGFAKADSYSSAFGEEHGSADTAAASSGVLDLERLNYTERTFCTAARMEKPLDYIFLVPCFTALVLDKATCTGARSPEPY